MNVDELWDNIVEYGIATERELQLVTDINGYTEKTLNDVIYARTGYRSWEQFWDSYEDYNNDL